MGEANEQLNRRKASFSEEAKMMWGSRGKFKKAPLAIAK